MIYGVEPVEALQAVENSLRGIVKVVMGDTWRTADGAPTQRRLERSRERERDRDRRDGAVVSDDLLNFTELSELTAIIRSNWQQFEQVFGDQDRTGAFLGVLEDLRNTVALSRELLPFERDLLNGVTGQIRNQVTLFRSTRESAESFYPVIETVTDSFGNLGGNNSDADMRNTDVRLSVGDTITFHCTGWDPRGRELTWSLLVQSRDTPRELISGGAVHLPWIVAEEDVGEKVWVRVRVTHSGRHHRMTQWGDFDDERVYTYDVNPPPD